jgi:hypothetical protein
LCRSHRGRNRCLVELAEHVVDVDDLALFFGAFCQYARFECRDFYGDLVGLEIDQRVAGGNDIALFLEPPGYGGLNDRLA